MLIIKLIDFNQHISELKFNNTDYKVGSSPQNINPEQALCLSLVSSIQAKVSLYTKENNIKLNCIECDADYNLHENKIKSIILNFKISGEFNDAQFEQIKLAAKDCCINNTLCATIEINISFVLIKFKDNLENIS